MARCLRPSSETGTDTLQLNSLTYTQMVLAGLKAQLSATDADDSCGGALVVNLKASARAGIGQPAA